MSDLFPFISDHDGVLTVWVCEKCGQLLGKSWRCNSGIHVGPDDADFGPASGHAVATTDLVTMLNQAKQHRDHWIRLWNRLEAAISHHKKATADFATEADEALYAARDRILRDAAS